MTHRFDLNRHLKLYREGKAGPLFQADSDFQVPVEPCRRCSVPRPDDGSRCPFCGAYQHCAFVTPASVSRNADDMEELVKSFVATPRARRRRTSRTPAVPGTNPAKPVNPRRRRKND